MSVRDGYKVTDDAKLPPKWCVSHVGELATIVSGSTPRTDIEKYWVNGNIPWATPTDITNTGKYINDTERKITAEGLKSCSSVLLPQGSILMTSRATIGACSINTTPMSTNQGFKSLIPNSKTTTEYLYYLMVNMTGEMVKLASGSTFLEISRSSVASLKLPLPPLPEQQKIAEILSTVDDHISETEALLDKTQVLKNGLMQHLMTQGIGHTEYKDTEIGRIPIEWGARSLYQICKKITDGSHFSPPAVSSGYFMASVKDMTDRGFNYDGCKMISEENHSKLARQGCNPLAGDVLIAKDGSILEQVFVQKENKDMTILSSIAIIRTDPAILDPCYLSQYLSWDSVKKRIKREFTTGSALPRIVLKNFRLVKVPLPTLSEQHKIADILSRMDDQIDTYQTKLASLTKLKSALMQQLLTGKIRVKV